MPTFFADDKLFNKSIALPVAEQFLSARAIGTAGLGGVATHLTKNKIRFQIRTIEKIVAWSKTAGNASELTELHTRQWKQLSELRLTPTPATTEPVSVGA